MDVSNWASKQQLHRTMAAQRVAVQLPQARPNEPVKMRTISRAKRSAGTAGWALRPPAFGLLAASADHTGTRSHWHNGA